MIVKSIAVVAGVVAHIGNVKFDFVWEMEFHPYNYPKQSPGLQLPTTQYYQILSTSSIPGCLSCG